MRRSPSAVVLAAAALLLGCHAARPTPAEGLAACDAARASARAALADHRACTADWDCEPFATPLLGCDGAVAAGGAPAGIERALVDACTNLPVRALRCTGQVAACVEGRCAFRKRTDTGCDAAKAALLARLRAADVGCSTDDGCAVQQVDDVLYPSARGFEREAARESWTFRDACGADQEWRNRLPAWPRCIERRCRAVTEHRPEDWVNALETDPGCLRRALAVHGVSLDIRDVRDPAVAPLFLRFPVRLDGRVGPFTLSRRVPQALEDAILAAVLSCRWRPARIYGVDRELARDVVMFVKS